MGISSADRPEPGLGGGPHLLSTWSEVVYIAFVYVFSRRIVGWKAVRSMSTSLVVNEHGGVDPLLEGVLAGLICHSDAGSPW